MENLMTVQDVAAYLGVPVATVFAWNSRGTGPRRSRVGKYVRYRRADVEAWLDQRAAVTS
jgi:excisionase family DNA binding protein